jgi:hypothetical protein
LTHQVFDFPESLKNGAEFVEYRNHA